VGAHGAKVLFLSRRLLYINFSSNPLSKKVLTNLVLASWQNSFAERSEPHLLTPAPPQIAVTALRSFRKFEAFFIFGREEIGVGGCWVAAHFGSWDLVGCSLASVGCSLSLQFLLLNGAAVGELHSPNG
jgi:hypothetical protein